MDYALLSVLAVIMNIAGFFAAIMGVFIILSPIISLFRGIKPNFRWYEYSYPFTTIWYILRLVNVEDYVPPIILSILALLGVIIFIADMIKSKSVEHKQRT